MKCEKCEREILDCVGECMYCNTGIREVYQEEKEVYHETPMD